MKLLGCHRSLPRRTSESDEKFNMATRGKRVSKFFYLLYSQFGVIEVSKGSLSNWRWAFGQSPSCKLLARNGKMKLKMGR